MNGAARALLATLLGPLGCTLVLDPGEQQCKVDADCQPHLPGGTCSAGVCVKPVDPVWGCLGNVVEPLPDPTQKVTITEQLTDTSQAPVTDATIDICAKLDVDCTSSDPNYPKGLHPDAQGSLTFSVIQGFDGFIRITATSFMDSRVYVGRPVVTPPAVKSVRLIQTSEYGAIAGFAKQTVDPTRGTAILYAVDCSGLAAGGVSFASPNADANSASFYLINQLPTLPPTATSTDKDGFGGIFNLPTGPAVATTTRASDQRPVGQSSFAVLANTISYVQIAPTPM